MTLNAKDAVLQGLRNPRAEGKRFFCKHYYLHPLDFYEEVK